MTASPTTLAAMYPSAAVTVVVERCERARREPRVELADAGERPAAGARRPPRPGPRSGRSPSAARRAARRATQRRRRAEAAANSAERRAPRPPSPGRAAARRARGRAAAGRRARIAFAASASTMNTPYAAKNPSVSAVRPNSRAMITPTTRGEPRLHGERGGGHRSRRQRAEAGAGARLAHRRGRVVTMANDTIWTESDLDRAARASSATSYGGRTVLVTGADGFMGSHLTEALRRARRATSTPSSAPPRAARSTTSGTAAASSRCTSPTSPTARRSTTWSAS